MKIIDLLVKIANEEEIPRKFIFDGDEFYLQSKTCYRCDEPNQIFEECLILEDLNKEVEIIEEDKKIDKLLGHYEGEAFNSKIQDKINEIIEVINGRD